MYIFRYACLLAAASAGLFVAASAEAEKRPNIVMILADDLGYGDLACYGRQDIQTPVLDRLAREGVRFTAYYANGPECTPTRTALLTGRYQQRCVGLECAIGTGNVGRYDEAVVLADRHNLGLPTQRQTIVRLLKDAGYGTAIVGKWHLGYEPKFAPNRHGFDYALYCLGGGMDYFHHVEPPPSGMKVLYRNGEQIDQHGYFTDMVSDEAVKYIQRQTDKPFFLYVPYTAPHSPFQGPDDDQPEPLPDDSVLWNQSNAPPGVYVAMIESMDRGIGRILASIDKQGLRETTLVIFASDNGGTRSARNAPFSGYKGSTYEGGVRVPAMARWPGKIPAGTVSDQACITFDLSASIVKAAGVSPAEDQPFDGIDILGHVAAKKPDAPRTLYWRKPRGETLWKGVRDGSLKYVSERKGERERDALYDLAQDAAEEHNLKDTRPGEFRRLKALYDAWEHETRANRR